MCGDRCTGYLCMRECAGPRGIVWIEMFGSGGLS
jgi:hypothetical protein